MTTASPPKWGPIILIGGTGRLGYYVAEQLLQQPECGTVISLNRSQKITHSCPGVEYRVADLRNTAALTKILEEIRPETIINVAAPAHTNTLTPKSEFEEVIVNAQNTLVRLAKQVGTKYMIYTTSANVAAGDEHRNIDETAPLWPEDSNSFAYWVQRARAEKLLLGDDCAALQTVSLRLPLIIGERDYAFTPAVVGSLERGAAGVQVGSDSGLLATVSGRDAARAHVLALRGLMTGPDNKVHGEAFYILGNQALSFWTMSRIIWTETGWKKEKEPFVLPEWLAWIIATVGEMLMKPFGKEPEMSTHVLKFMFNTWTYNGRKARDVLGYEPQDDTAEELRKSVRWHLKNDLGREEMSGKST